VPSEKGTGLAFENLLVETREGAALARFEAR
jgi:hypothetical protein